MDKTQNTFQLTTLQQWGLIILRIVIGWHFLYEGIVKLMDPGWTAESYLLNSCSFMSTLFQAIASHPQIMGAIDFLNVWGLIMIGLGLFLGLFARAAMYAGILLLTFYYSAYPPFLGYNYGVPQEGHYMVFDKTFIELGALIILAFFPSTLNIGVQDLLKNMGLRIFKLVRLKRGERQLPPVGTNSLKTRRDMLKNLAFLPFLGGFSWGIIKKIEGTAPDATSGSTIILGQRSVKEIEGKIPMGILANGKPPVSRLIMGTNLISGTAHARDLKYARALFKAYNTEGKIMETYRLAVQTGINLFFATPHLMKYKNIYGGNFQTWLNVVPTKEDIYGQVDKVIDQGVDYIYVQGAACDKRVHAGEIDVVLKCLDYIKQQGYPAGLGAHTIQAMKACVEAGADPDFYYKTMHHDNYWSAHPQENREPFLWSSNISGDHNRFHDNMWCLFPEETVDFIQKVKKPVVGFKVLAGGAILPEDGFQWAFDNGADFIEVGMFDFQVVEDVIQVIRSIGKAKDRSRPWYG